MANPVDFNYAIDLDGHIYPGQATKIRDMKKESLEKLAPHDIITSKMRPDVM